MKKCDEEHFKKDIFLWVKSWMFLICFSCTSSWNKYEVNIFARSGMFIVHYVFPLLKQAKWKIFLFFKGCMRKNRKITKYGYFFAKWLLFQMIWFYFSYAISTIWLPFFFLILRHTLSKSISIEKYGYGYGQNGYVSNVFFADLSSKTNKNKLKLSKQVTF